MVCFCDSLLPGPVCPRSSTMLWCGARSLSGCLLSMLTMAITAPPYQNPGYLGCFCIVRWVLSQGLSPQNSALGCCVLSWHCPHEHWHWLLLASAVIPCAHCQWHLRLHSDHTPGTQVCLCVAWSILLTFCDRLLWAAPKYSSIWFRKSAAWKLPMHGALHSDYWQGSNAPLTNRV